MLTDSVASSIHDMPRSTRDLDIVITLARDQLLALMQEFPSARYYADGQQALQALSKGSQFNIIDFATGWKVDFIIAAHSEYGRTALKRRMRMDVAGTLAYVASLEDVLLAKLQWAKGSGSDRQLQDAADIVPVRAGRLDRAYIECWVAKLHVQE
jgi:hypothetical protein